ncbi:hypothetical protein SAMN04488550_3012 [Gordonia malaquae]|uniref:Uncharacterized protein n=1 Tax=Gordonia malaquae NBRC 108250 TaxID=1223542 RepID=M3VBV4_GORML|nr:hypothetical protein [Gordonia malaquae]GAC80918.1 hypothetical protein GM1_024_00370 [Gordonia malaquae NBRC 108250]SED70726.1 hypothetical protein SAMN04488550_3012 [Gordonia malaquae]
MKIRLAVAAVAASAALLGGVVAAPAHAAPTGQSLAAKNALDSINPQPQDAASVIDGIEAANALLKKMGITPFTPTIGACTDFTFPLALGGAMPGPNTPLLGDLEILGLDLNTVKKGEVLYGFVPVGVFNDSGDKAGMQVAWFNVNTFKGGLGAPMDGLADTLVNATVKRVKELSPVPVVDSIVTAAVKTTLKPVLDLLPSNGVRGGLVDTGSGTVLSAIYGSVKKGDATCYFFPSLGIATAK